MQPLSDLNELKVILEIHKDNTAEDSKLLFFLDIATEWVAEFLGRPELFLATRTEYYDGWNTQFLTLTRRPVFTSGMEVYVDSQGNYGQSSGGFASNTLLTMGTDYVLRVDQPNGSSRCGILQRINNVWPRPFVRRTGLLTPIMTRDTGSIKVTYSAGWTVDGLPSQVRFACNLLASKIRYLMPVGMEINSENYKDRSISIATTQKDYLMQTVKDMLFPWRNWKFN